MYNQDEPGASGRFPHYPEFVPDELKVAARWVCCDEKKVPMIALPSGVRRRASHSDPATWRSYDTALKALKTGRFWGIGRVFEKGAPYVGIDLDKCLDPETGQVNAWAWGIVERLDSYSEISPSGTGIKIWVKAPGLSRAHRKPGLEIYPHRRYFTVTGQFLSQCPATVEERADELADIIAREFPTARRKKDSSKQSNGANGAKSRVAVLPFLEAVGVEVLAELPDETGRKFAIRCPWAHEHSGGDESGTYVIQFESGQPVFWCWHAHCANRRWSAFKRRVCSHLPHDQEEF